MGQAQILAAGNRDRFVYAIACLFAMVGWDINWPPLLNLPWNTPRGQLVWAFHDDVEIGPKMLARIAKHTGLRPEDL